MAKLATDKSGTLAALAEHNIVEFSIWSTGETRDTRRGAPRQTTNLARNVRISGERIWQ